MANASLARVPVLLIGGCTSRPQANMGPLQDIPHVDILRPVTRYSRTARVADQVDPRARRGDRAGRGRHGRAGTGLYRDPDRRAAQARAPATACSTSGLIAPKPRRRPAPERRLHRGGRRRDPRGEAPAGRHRPRRARRGRRRWCAFLDATDALYLDTQESRGLVPADHPSSSARCAARRWAQADLVIIARPQARLPDGLRLAGRVSGCAVSPHRRHRRRADRQPAGRARNCWPTSASRCDAIATALGNDAGARDERLDSRVCAPSRHSARSRSGPRRHAAADRRGRQDPPDWRSSTRSQGGRRPTTSPSPTAAIC